MYAKLRAPLIHLLQARGSWQWLGLSNVRPFLLEHSQGGGGMELANTSGRCVTTLALLPPCIRYQTSHPLAIRLARRILTEQADPWKLLQQGRVEEEELGKKQKTSKVKEHITTIIIDGEIIKIPKLKQLKRYAMVDMKSLPKELKNVGKYFTNKTTNVPSQHVSQTFQHFLKSKYAPKSNVEMVDLVSEEDFVVEVNAQKTGKKAIYVKKTGKS